MRRGSRSSRASGPLLAGVGAFAAVLARGDVRPLHVSGALGAGAATYLGGRVAVVALHELAHALTLASFGRRPRRIGIKLVAGVPYAFVDTSDAWLEPRRRIAVSAAGPGTDLVLAGAFALAALASSGAAADVAFQLALGGYIGALMNLNPLLERDGYHVLIDLLGEADLRRRAQRRLL